jgi:heme oxygenase
MDGIHSKHKRCCGALTLKMLVGSCPNSQLIRSLDYARIQQPSGVEVGQIIEKIANGKWQLSEKTGTWFLVFDTW